MAEFPHLKLPYKIEGSAKPSGGGGKKDAAALAKTAANKANRQNHGQALTVTADVLIAKWEQVKSQKQAEGIDVPNEMDIPLFLQVDTSQFEIESLRHWVLKSLLRKKMVSSSVRQQMGWKGLRRM